MKYLKTLLFVLFVFISTAVYASYSTYEIVVDTQILTKGGSLCSILIMSNGTDDARVILYDVDVYTDAAPTNKLVEITVAGADNYGGRIWADPVRFTEGIWADIDGTGASFILEWNK